MFGSKLYISQHFLENPSSDVGADRSVTFNTIILFDIGLKRRTGMLLRFCEYKAQHVY